MRLIGKASVVAAFPVTVAVAPEIVRVVGSPNAVCATPNASSISAMAIQPPFTRAGLPKSIVSSPAFLSRPSPKEAGPKRAVRFFSDKLGMNT